MLVGQESSRAKIGLFSVTIFILIAMGFIGPVEAKKHGTFVGTASVTKGSTLRIECRRGNIVIRSGTADFVQVRADIHDSTDQGDLPGRYTPAEIIAYLERKPPIEQKGNEVHIGSMVDDEFHLGVAINYEIVAPAWVELEIEAKEGDLGIHEVGDRIEVDKNVGSVRIQDPRGKLTATIDDGSLQVLGTPREEWSLKSAAGSLEVVVPKGQGFELDAKSSEGRLDSDVPLGEHKQGRFEGAINGGGPRIRLRSESGIVAVRQR